MRSFGLLSIFPVRIFAGKLFPTMDRPWWQLTFGVSSLKVNSAVAIAQHNLGNLIYKFVVAFRLF